MSTSSPVAAASRRSPPASPPSSAAAPGRQKAPRPQPSRRRVAPADDAPALDGLPLNIVLLGKGNTVSAAGLAEQALAGAGGYKVHEDWGSTPAAIDSALTAAGGACRCGAALGLAQRGPASSTRQWRRSTAAASTPSTSKAPAVAMRPTSCRSRGCRTSSRFDQPDAAAHRQHRRRAPRHVDGLSPPEPGGARDLAFAESRIRGTTIAAEDILHDMGHYPSRRRTPRRWAVSARSSARGRSHTS